MIIYLIKLILILVFDIGVNTYYINSGCNCCCCESNKNNSGGGKQVDKIEIDLNNHTLKYNGKILQGFKKTEDLTSINPEMVIHVNFRNVQNIYYTIDEDIFNSIKEDSKVEIIKNSDLGDTYIVFAVKTRVEKFNEVNPKYDYYIVYCHNGNSVNTYYDIFDGLFERIVANDEIKILGSGNNLTNTSYMFYDGKNLTKITFNKTCFNTSNVNNMKCMFNDCEKLEELDLSTFDTSKVKSMDSMFSGCSSLKKLNVSNFNTNNVTDMSYMFYKCNSLTSLDVSSFNTRKVTNMNGMFYGCNSLTSLDVSSFNTQNVTDMEGMFNCMKLRIF